ncbi:hypothetical protein SDC9_204553 [bioreactor metagenome]|uniref:Uncharacterized protein n=1 Tax=bioreactor metagenome TaxID=1076179 RepID=A0A645J118_9ZZZZ
MRENKKEIKLTDTLSHKELKQQVLSEAETNPNVKLKAVEESSDIVHLVLPQKLNAASGGCIGCDGVGGCGFCECKSNIGDQVRIRDQVQIKNQKQIKNKLQR